MAMPESEKVFMAALGLISITVGAFIVMFPDRNVQLNKQLLEKTGFSRSVPSFMTTNTWCRALAIWVALVGCLFLTMVVWSAR